MNSSNPENSKSDVGSRGKAQNGLQQNSFNVTTNSNQGMNSIQMANAYCQESS